MRRPSTALSVVIPITLLVNPAGLPELILGARAAMTGVERPATAAVPAAVASRAGARPPILDHLAGSWEGDGELFGRPTRFAMTWEWELGEAFLGLRYEIRGEVRMDARAHYRIVAGDTLDGVWVDSRGEIVELAAVGTDSTLETEWRSPTERGRTVYRRTAPDSLHVQDFVGDGTGWRLFGDARYARR